VTKEERAAARARCEAATEGPWEQTHSVSREGPGCLVHHQAKTGAPWTICQWTVCQCINTPKNNAVRDATFVAHARADLPAALDEIDRLEALLRKWDIDPDTGKHKTYPLTPPA
jgi:hypothetical protein